MWTGHFLVERLFQIEGTGTRQSAAARNSVNKPHSSHITERASERGANQRMEDGRAAPFHIKVFRVIPQEREEIKAEKVVTSIAAPHSTSVVLSTSKYALTHVSL